MATTKNNSKPRRILVEIWEEVTKQNVLFRNNDGLYIAGNWYHEIELKNSNGKLYAVWTQKI